MKKANDTALRNGFNEPNVLRSGKAPNAFTTLSFRIQDLFPLWRGTQGEDNVDVTLREHFDTLREPQGSAQCKTSVYYLLISIIIPLEASLDQVIGNPKFPQSFFDGRELCSLEVHCT